MEVQAVLSLYAPAIRFGTTDVLAPYVAIQAGLSLYAAASMLEIFPVLTLHVAIQAALPLHASASMFMTTNVLALYVASQAVLSFFASTFLYVTTNVLAQAGPGATQRGADADAPARRRRSVETASPPRTGRWGGEGLAEGRRTRASTRE